jgi:hypothetical protein
MLVFTVVDPPLGVGTPATASASGQSGYNRRGQERPQQAIVSFIIL